MGMFDQVTPFTEHFREGPDHPFDLEAAKLGPVIDTDYGPNQSAHLKIGGKWFSIFGQGIVAQIERMDKGDLPATVYIGRVKSGKSGDREVKVIVPEGMDPSAMDKAVAQTVDPTADRS